MQQTRERPVPPTSVGPYRIAGRLGGGGMGEVYRAHDARLERWVAIKQLHPDVAREEAQRNRFRREARAVASLNHPAIVQIYDILEDPDGGDWIVMELVEGRSLKALLGDGPLEPARIVDLARQITEGLAVAHARGIVHRDLKIENVMVVASGHVKILDFGLAKDFAKTTDSSSISATDTVLGTSRAMSPEQVMGFQVDHRSDLFSLGTLLFELVTGESPFRAANSILTLARVCNHRQPPVTDLRPDIPVAFSRLVDRLLAKDPEERPQSTREVLEILKELEGEESGRVRAPNPVSAAVRPPPAIHALRRERRRPSETAPSGFYIKTLLLVSLAGAEELAARLGETRAREISTRYDRMTRKLLERMGGLEIQRTEGFLLLFERPVDAVEFALVHQQRLRRLAADLGDEVEARAAIHVGEVFLHQNGARDLAVGAHPFEVEGRARRIVARLVELARPSQILLTREAFELSRRALDETPVDGGAAGGRASAIRWASHGRYPLLEGEPRVSLYEVGDRGRAPFKAPRRRLRGGRWLAAAAVAALAFAAGWALVAPRVRETRPTVAVLGFKNLSERPLDGWLSTALSELVTSELAAGGELRVIQGEAVARMMRELELEESEILSEEALKSIGRNLGADFVVVGSFMTTDPEDGKKISFHPVLQSVGERETVATISVEGDESKLLDIASQTGRQLRGLLDVGNPTAAESAAVSATLPASPKAARLYSEGLIRLRRYDALGARTLLEKAVEEDPGYAPAYAALSEAWACLGYGEKARHFARRAVDLADELPREAHLRIEGRSYEVANQWQDAVEVYKVLWRFFPDDLEYGLSLAGAQTDAGEMDAAMTTIDELRRLAPPARDDPRIDMMEVKVAQDRGDYAAMLRAAGRAERKGRAQRARILVGDALQAQAWAQRQTGAHDEALGAFELARQLFHDIGYRSKEAEVLNGLAVLRQDSGDLEKAKDLYRQSMHIHRETGNEWWRATILGNLAFVFELQGELTIAESLGNEAADFYHQVGDLREEQIQREYRVTLLVGQGRLEEARQLVDAYRSSGVKLSRDSEVWRDFMEAELEIAEGDLRRASRSLEATLEVLPEVEAKDIPGYVYHCLGKIHLARGDFAVARRWLDQSRSIRTQNGQKALLATTELTAARLLVAEGRFAEAEKLARRVLAELRRANILDGAAAADLVLAEALHARGAVAEARLALARASERATHSENPTLRLTVALDAARFLADDEPAAAQLDLETVLEKAVTHGLGGLELQARLALGRVELATNPAAARLRLGKLKAEAERMGWGSILRQAARLADS